MPTFVICALAALAVVYQTSETRVVLAAARHLMGPQHLVVGWIMIWLFLYAIFYVTLLGVRGLVRRMQHSRPRRRFRRHTSFQ